MTSVINCRDRQKNRVPADMYVYCGRPSKWGNPFVIGAHGPRDAVIRLFHNWWYAPQRAQLRADAVRELAGKTLGCFCAPKPCHCDVIAEFVNRSTGVEPTE